MQTVDFETPFKVGEQIIERAEVKPIGFVRFVEIGIEAVSREGRAETLIQRARMKEQVRYLTKDGKAVAVDDASLGGMGIKDARKIIALLNEGHGEEGKVLQDGDGMISSIVYKLGTPIGNEGKKISELEFLASTFGQVEDCLAIQNPMEQTVELIRTIAKPAGDTKLISLPSWAVDAITLADGTTIAQKVAPRFFG